MANHITLKIYLLLCFVVLAINYMSAQIPQHFHFGLKEGLPSDFVYKAIQDHQGYMWFCTDNGIAKFNGYKFQIIDASDGLTNSDVWDLCLDGDKIWVESFDDICYIRNDSLIKLKKPDNYQGEGVCKHKFFDDAHLIFFESNKTQYLELIEDSIIVHSKAYDHNILHFKNRDEYILYHNKIGTKDVIFKQFEGGSLVAAQTVKNYFDIPRASRLYTGFINNKIYLINRDDTYIVDSEEINYFKNVDFLEVEEINYINVFDGYVYIESKGEIIIKDKDFQNLNSFRSFLNKRINSFFIDHDNNVWVSTPEGIDYYINRVDEVLNYSLPDLTDTYTSVTKMSDGQISLTSKNGIVYHFVPKESPKEFYSTNLTQLSNIVLSPYDQKTYLVDASKGIFISDLKEGNYFQNTASYPASYPLWNNSKIQENVAYTSFPCAPKDIDIRFNGDMAIAHSGGVSLIEQDSIRRITDKRSYALKFIDDKLWMGSTKGLSFYDLLTRKSSDVLDSFFIKEIAQDLNGNIWIGTDGNGLIKIEGDSIKHIKGLEHLTINKIFVDEDNVLWVASFEGVFKIQFVGSELKVENFNNSDGIAVRNVIDIMADENNVYAMDQKLLSVFKKDLEYNIGAKPLIFNSIKVNGNEAYSYNFDHNQNNIEISFHTISYRHMGQLSYEWKLEGQDDDWKRTKNTSVSFNLLPPGDYTFSVRTLNGKNNFINTNNELKFSISFPWYRTSLFYIFSFLALLCLVYLIMNYRLNRQQKISDQKAEIQKQFYELRLKAVQAQMNPHFIFNALNSIQNYIYENDKEIANDYIVSFAKLMRLILESTSKKYVPLKDEIELLQLYTSLEQMRFQNTFDVVFDIDGSIDSNSIEIPSALLQPFVENAINHGIAPKKTHSKLIIAISLNSNQLICIIEDDGVGREKAAKLKKVKHVSRAMEILIERKQILSEKDNLNINFDIIDLFNELKEPRGTKVIITIPI